MLQWMRQRKRKLTCVGALLAYVWLLMLIQLVIGSWLHSFVVASWHSCAIYARIDSFLGQICNILTIHLVFADLHCYWTTAYRLKSFSFSTHNAILLKCMQNCTDQSFRWSLWIDIFQIALENIVLQAVSELSESWSVHLMLYLGITWCLLWWYQRQAKYPKACWFNIWNLCREVVVRLLHQLLPVPEFQLCAPWASLQLFFVAEFGIFFFLGGGGGQSIHVGLFRFFSAVISCI